MPKSDATIRIEYADMLSGDEDRSTVQLIRDLEARSRPGDPWEELPARPVARQLHACEAAPRRGIWRRRRGFGRVTQVCAGLAVALLGVSLALAASGILDLGKPTSDLSTSPYFPLSGFHRISTNLRANARPELLFISTQNDSFAAAERWALVKSLDQFGALSHVASMTVFAPIEYQGPFRHVREPQPTFDLAHAVYRSRYLSFVHKDVLDVNNRLYQRLNGTEQRLYARYARSKRPFGSHDPDNFLGTMNNTDAKSGHRFPLIAVGGYLQTASNVLYPLDFLLVETGPTVGQVPATYATFSQVQQSLVSHTPASQMQPTLLPDINAETNVLTALICHADGSRPKAVCRRPVIERLLRHVR